MKILRKATYLFLFSVLYMIAISCNDHLYYNQYTDFESKEWYYDSLATFQFTIDEANEPFNLYYNVRNDLDYPFYNLYIKYELTDENGQILRSNLHEANLMHPITGAPLGTGESIYDNEILLLKDYKFPKTGVYNFSMKQYMRQDTLSGILAVGFSVEKSEK